MMSSGSKRQWGGKALVSVMLLLRTVALGGCGPKKGTLGGECDDNGCNAYCEDGSRCDNSSNTCVADTTRSAPSGPPTGCNFNGTDSRCSAGQTAYQCLGGTTPGSETSVPGCAYVSMLDSENALYCCTPTCTLRESQWCERSATYICSGSALPQDVDPSAACVVRTSYWGFAEYCCAAPNTCFVWRDLQSDCTRDEELRLCAGVAPAAETCQASASDAGGLRAYCCKQNIGDAGDAG
jgi:hypothetical protein